MKPSAHPWKMSYRFSGRNKRLNIFSNNGNGPHIATVLLQNGQGQAEIDGKLMECAPMLYIHLKSLLFAIEEGVQLTKDHAAYVVAKEWTDKAGGKE